MNETEAYGKYGQGYIYPNNGMYHAGFITDEVIDDIREVWEEEGRPDGDLKTFIENNSYDLDLDEDGETVYGYDFASFDEAERWVNQQLKSSRNASKKIADDEDLMPRPFKGEDPRWQYIGNGWSVSKDGREEHVKWYRNNYTGFVSKTYGGKWYGHLNGPSMPRKFGPFNTAEEAMDVVDDWAHGAVEYEENAVSASKKRKVSKKVSWEMMPKSQWETYLGPGDHDDIDRLYADRSDPDSFIIIDADGRMTVFGPDDPDHFDPDSWATL